MRSGLRWRLTLGVGGFTAVAVIVASLATGELASYELLHEVDGGGAQGGSADRVAGLAHELGVAWDDSASREARVEQVARGLGDGYALLLLDAAGAPLVRSARLEGWEVETVDGQVRLGDDGRRLAITLAGGEPVESGGQRVGWLHTIRFPRGHAEEGAAVRAWAVLVAVVTSLLAMAVTALYLRRALTPIERLTESLRSRRHGRDTNSIQVVGQDEIGELVAAFDGYERALSLAEARRRQLTGDVAHELRTPLTNARCRLEAVRDGVLEPTAEELESLLEELLLLGRLVDDLQLLAQAEEGRLGLELEPLDLDLELSNRVRNFTQRSAGQGPRATFLAENGPSGGRRVLADRVRLHQILSNLLENARVNTPEDGSITVHVGTAGDLARVEVRDDGRGIPEDELANVFERFHRVDPSRSRATGGSGLGLPIVRELIEAHGGTVTIASRPDQGTTVAFTLPLA